MLSSSIGILAMFFERVMDQEGYMHPPIMFGPKGVHTTKCLVKTVTFTCCLNLVLKVRTSV